ncbi:MAG: YjbQ family protein [Spirochaetes bacterium]|nr:YjbQ family protein [Spirochaetota bacterium]
MKKISVKTGYKEEVIDVTREVLRAVYESKIENGICCIYTPHTTAAITINENADPDVKSDILKGLLHLGFEKMRFDHTEGNSPAHLKSSIIGCSENVIIENNELCLGTWQGIYFCEFDGPRNRNIYVKVI